MFVVIARGRTKLSEHPFDSPAEGDKGEVGGVGYCLEETSTQIKEK